MGLFNSRLDRVTIRDKEAQDKEEEDKEREKEKLVELRKMESHRVSHEDLYCVHFDRDQN